ncbi:hypothetical protein SAMN04489740_0854 [Arthrobacter alpinus]|uniref:Uncharacterized protein n=1 Tax=Arthrobacter alpinus TaxID=656366 RepID=A0A1H5GV90_9MICC|nr:hypothetical protein [Arthrobacter alpinus]SEE19381.1 hypothetical protein SAMN04489740_0854 [Arthrobacter alpinus]
MPLTSVFYAGPSTDTDRAKYRAGAAAYGVNGADDFKVTGHPSIPYALAVKAGEAHGYGVTDIADEDQLVQCATLATGTRWDLIVDRRNWQSLLGGPSTLEVIQGGATIPNIQTLRTKGPGVEDDQPLALVEWKGGINTPNKVIDLRCWVAPGGYVIADLLARDYLAQPGAEVLLGSTTYRYTMGANGVWGWVDQTQMLTTASPMSGNVKPDWAPLRTWSGYVSVSSGAGGDNRTATAATNATGEGGLWFGYNGLPNFSGVYSVQLTGEHALPQFAHVPTVLNVSATRIKFKSRRLDSSNWANGYAGISMYVTVVGW